MSVVPILVEAGALHVLVVGGGTVAARKAAHFARAAVLRVVAPDVCAELEALANAGAATVERRLYEAGDIGDANLVIAATNDRGVNATVAADARRACRLVNVADAPDDGAFTFMATHRSGLLTVGVSAGGVPTAAARIRDAIAERFDERYADALRALATVRRTLLDAGETERWRELAAASIDAEFCRAVEAGTACDRTGAWR